MRLVRQPKTRTDCYLLPKMSDERTADIQPSASHKIHREIKENEGGECRFFSFIFGTDEKGEKPLNAYVRVPTNAHDILVREITNLRRNWGTTHHDTETIRLATKDKRPQYGTRTNGPTIKEKRKRTELLRINGEGGTRTGTAIGTGTFNVADFDLAHLPPGLRANIERGLLLLLGTANQHGTKCLKTIKGWHIVGLTKKQIPNGRFYVKDKYGKEGKIGEMLSKGRQAQAYGSHGKELVDSGNSIRIKAANAQEVKNRLARFFIELRYTDDYQQKTSKKTPLNIKQRDQGKPTQKHEQNTSKHTYTSEIVKPRRILKQETGARNENYQRITYLTQAGQTRYFLAETIRSSGTRIDRKLELLRNTQAPPALGLKNGRTHQFLNKILIYDNQRNTQDQPNDYQERLH